MIERAAIFLEFIVDLDFTVVFVPYVIYTRKKQQ